MSSMLLEAKGSVDTTFQDAELLTSLDLLKSLSFIYLRLFTAIKVLQKLTRRVIETVGVIHFCCEWLVQ